MVAGDWLWLVGCGLWVVRCGLLVGVVGGGWWLVV